MYLSYESLSVEHELEVIGVVFNATVLCYPVATGYIQVDIESRRSIRLYASHPRWMDRWIDCDFNPLGKEDFHTKSSIVIHLLSNEEIFLQ